MRGPSGSNLTCHTSDAPDHAIPHFKAKISGEFESRRPRYGSTFISCQAIFKNPVLVHREGLVPFVSISSVCKNLKFVKTL